ncbi:hypothetical protein OPT61_g2197 [Boeremia exigua]|uniref:Uncharacterized protein n=1 Tax=Boeremia exigua TaxID=749465 RepID=A0ACC2IMJ7_9PLEO|nr:hypothetical protein OPT61_g2197 [Boeremia exigua]
MKVTFDFAPELEKIVQLPGLLTAAHLSKKNFFAVTNRKRDWILDYRATSKKFEDQCEHEWNQLEGIKFLDRVKAVEGDPYLPLEAKKMWRDAKTAWQTKFLDWKPVSEERREALFGKQGSENSLGKLLGGVWDKAWSTMTAVNKRYNYWYLDYDDAFAGEYCSSLPTTSGPQTQRCCFLCNRILSQAKQNRPIPVQFDKILQAAEQCVICRLLGEASKAHVSEAKGTVEFYRTGSFLRAYAGGPRLVRLCADATNGECIRLVNAADRSSTEFLALSHCWGKLTTEEKRAFCTTSENIRTRYDGFSVFELPKTFQDAIMVTRALGIRYLWIDSICIIQYGDNNEDWRHQCTEMKLVYSQAYCVIAATAATSSFSGFLNQPVSSAALRVEDHCGHQFFVSTDIDDYDNDVARAALNSRAWVMQESVLARRTIHFTAHINEYYTLDPHFPKRILVSLELFMINHALHYLVREYTKRDITFPCDRAVAIAGLEQRLSETLVCESRYFIFEKSMHRQLMWLAVSEQRERIDYDSPIPSWSWMAWTGPIDFPNFYPKLVAGSEFLDIDVNVNVRFHATRKDALKADLGRLKKHTLRQHSFVSGEDCREIVDELGQGQGQLAFDASADEHPQPMFCIVVGRDRPVDRRIFSMYNVLIVVPTDTVGEYRRIGIGKVDPGFVIKETDDVLVV